MKDSLTPIWFQLLLPFIIVIPSANYSLQFIWINREKFREVLYRRAVRMSCSHASIISLVLSNAQKGEVALRLELDVLSFYAFPFLLVLSYCHNLELPKTGN